MKASDAAKKKTARGDAVLSTRTEEFYTVLGEIGASVYIAPTEDSSDGLENVVACARLDVALFRLGRERRILRESGISNLGSRST